MMRHRPSYYVKNYGLVCTLRHFTQGGNIPQPNEMINFNLNLFSTAPRATHYRTNKLNSRVIHKFDTLCTFQSRSDK